MDRASRQPDVARDLAEAQAIDDVRRDDVSVLRVEIFQGSENEARILGRHLVLSRSTRASLDRVEIFDVLDGPGEALAAMAPEDSAHATDGVGEEIHGPGGVIRLPADEDERDFLRHVGVDVLVIDDASPDGTGEVAEVLRGRFPRLSVLHRRSKEGLGPAYLHGFREAMQRGYSRVVTMDADLSHSPEDVPRLIAGLASADVVLGSRHVAGGGVEDWPFGRRILSRAGSVYARALLRLAARDVTTGFRAYRVAALEKIDFLSIGSGGFAFQIEILAQILALDGARFAEVPIVFRNRALGRSKLTVEIVREAVFEVARLAWSLRRTDHAVRCVPPARRGRPRGPRSWCAVIPARPGEGCILPELRALVTAGAIEDVTVVEGRAPSAQRNAAVRASTSEAILFLDDDSAPSPDLVERYDAAFRLDPRLAAIGGPAIYSGSTFFARVASAVFAEPSFLGRSAARYGPVGALRASDERELILANLAVRRDAFEAAGGLDEDLYPNEENALLERLAALGHRVAYEPRAVVHRPAPESVGELLSKVHGYGRGRADQARKRWSAISAFRVLAPLVALAVAGGALAALPWSLVPGVAVASIIAAWVAAAGWRMGRRHGAAVGLVGPLVGGMMLIAYATGVARGCICSRAARRSRIFGRFGVVLAGTLAFSGNGWADADDAAAKAEVPAALEVHAPFPPGARHEVLCGPGDAPHHLDARNRHAFDFAMPPGSLVSAALGGVVARVVAQNDGPTGRSSDNNLIALRHDDGTVAEYHHLLRDGVLVRPGERVERGEVIGFSGHSGRAEGPHLHFVVLRGETSLPLRFSGRPTAPLRGDDVSSENVPKSVEDRYRRLQSVRGALRETSDAAAVAAARDALDAPRLAAGVAARRSALSLRLVEDAIARRLKEISRLAETGVEAPVETDERKTETKS